MAGAVPRAAVFPAVAVVTGPEAPGRQFPAKVKGGPEGSAPAPAYALEGRTSFQSSFS